MAFKFFTIPARDDGRAEADLNGFLRSHTVLAVEQRWVEQGVNSFWRFCVDYVDSAAATPNASRATNTKGKVDYREVLSPEDFAVYAQLRELREQLAKRDSVPLYTVFTNEHLAQMVRTRATTQAALERIPGVASGRSEKYGPAFLELLSKQWNGEHATAQPPV